MKPYTIKCKTTYGSFIETAYATLRAATRLDRLLEVGEDRITVEDDETFSWEIDVFADSEREAREALAKVLTRFPAITPA